MSRPMNMQEFASLLNLIKNHHSPMSHSSGCCVKYADPVIDFRTFTVFSITFRTFGAAEHVFHCQNECRDLPEPLYDRCVNWLRSRP